MVLIVNIKLKDVSSIALAVPSSLLIQVGAAVSVPPLLHPASSFAALVPSVATPAPSPSAQPS